MDLWITLTVLIFCSFPCPCFFLTTVFSFSFTTSQCPLFTHCLPCTCSLMSCGDFHVCLWVSIELDLSLPIDSSVLVLTWRTYMHLNWSRAPSDSYTDSTYLHDHNFRPVVLMGKPSHQCFVYIRRSWSCGVYVTSHWSPLLDPCPPINHMQCMNLNREKHRKANIQLAWNTSSPKCPKLSSITKILAWLHATTVTQVTVALAHSHLWVSRCTWMRSALLLTTDQSEDPLIWWKLNQHRFHTLSRLAQKYLTMQATSVPAERLFSKAGMIITRKCTTLWWEPDWVQAQNMEQLHAFDSHQNVAEPQATENQIKYTHVYTGTVSQAWLQYTSMLHTGWFSTGCRSWRWHGQMTAP